MNKTFPESINDIDVNNVPQSLAIIRDYINYMCERMDYTILTMEKLVGLSSTVDVVERLAELEADVTRLDSTISSINATATHANTVAEEAEEIASGMDSRLSTLENTTIPAIQGDINTINNTTIPAIQADVTAIDTKVGKLESSLADVESGAIATMAHAQNTYFVWKGQFVKATSNIAVGDTISSSNTTATTILSAIGEIYSDTTGASKVGIDNSNNGLSSTDTQGAIDEIVGIIYTVIT